jgi:hypothetical protein
MEPSSPKPDRVERRQEALARTVGAAVGLSAMALAWVTIRWPAPAIAFAIGFMAYLSLRPRPS